MSLRCAPWQTLYITPTRVGRKPTPSYERTCGNAVATIGRFQGRYLFNVYSRRGADAGFKILADGEAKTLAAAKAKASRALAQAAR